MSSSPKPAATSACKTNDVVFESVAASSVEPSNAQPPFPACELRIAPIASSGIGSCIAAIANSTRA
jgi:hypothetical protein